MSIGQVYIGKIIQLSTILNADFILSATVVCGAGGKWQGVVRKQDFAVADGCVVYLPDSLIPERADMAFMAATDWRVKMRRFKGAPSEVVIMPLTEGKDNPMIGEDVTELFGVTKYIKPIPPSLAGKAKGNFPSFIPRTDEPNWQRSEDLIALLKGKPYYITEKADGSSTTAYKWKGQFGVCSRNLELIEDANNGYWQIALRYKLAELLPEGYAIQWETCGPKIQGNPMGLKQIEGCAFNVYDISAQRYLELADFCDFCENLKFPKVNIIKIWPEYEEEDLNLWAKGTYTNGKEREGIVIRSQDYIDGKIISFKAINLDYKD